MWLLIVFINDYDYCLKVHLNQDNVVEILGDILQTS
jgi:hypothetical protein